MRSTGCCSLTVVKLWRTPWKSITTSAVTRSPSRSTTRAPPHHGRKSGYDSMSATSANIAAALWRTRTVFSIDAMRGEA